MGRKPNPLILEYFVRGPKLNDNSNRYPHTCKQCGENFPKGRIDSLTTHITKRCPAITESDRMRACLELHGISNARIAADRNHRRDTSGKGQADLSVLPQGWSALETLAEASRQVDLNENSRGQQVQDRTELALSPANEHHHLPDRFELQEEFTFENPPVSYESHVQGPAKRGPISAVPPAQELTPEERLQAFLPSASASSEPSNLSVAVAATARLNPSLLDPQLASSDATSTSAPIPEAVGFNDSTKILTHINDAAQPWGEMTYLGATLPITRMLHDNPVVPAPLTRGGIPMDTSEGILNGRPRHSRARFTAERRKEVQEVRKIGACIRCRILRKNCGKGTPCDTCRKVLSPRVWRTGCVRSRLHEQFDLYAAGVQVVLSQNRINILKDQLQLIKNGTVVEVSHFPDSDQNITFNTLVVLVDPTESQAASRDSKKPFPQVIMIDQDAEDIPDKIEKYVGEVLPLFIEREPSAFMRVTLELATKYLDAENDDLIRKSLELWGLVESIDRERQWSILEKPGVEGDSPRSITEAQDADDADIYTMICMQLNAAAERKANNTSKNLLNMMDRLLTDSKTKIGFNMYLTAIIFLNCVEKSTWAFKAWEQDHLRPGWPLERDPGMFTQQGGHLAGLLKMLLAIRKALPQTSRSAVGKLMTNERDSAVVEYFQRIDLDYDYVEARQNYSAFSPVDSRSLELSFSSILLLPN